MSEQQVEIKITADTGDAEQGFKRLGDDVEDLEGSAKKASSGFKGFFTELNQGRQLIGQAFSDVGNVINGAFDAISRGATVDDITTSFQKLSAQAGATGDALLKGFGDALGNTIPKVDLMKQANELLVGGLDPKDFNLVADAARSLGEFSGTNAVDGLEKLTNSLLRGNDVALKKLGITVDNKKALDDYAASLGTSAKFLTEEERLEANRIAVIDALRGSTEKLGKATDDAGDRVDQIKSAITDQKDAAFAALANNEDLNKSLGELAKNLKEIDFGPLIAAMGFLLNVTAKLSSAISRDLVLAFNQAKTAQDTFYQAHLDNTLPFGLGLITKAIRDLNAETAVEVKTNNTALKSLGSLDTHLTASLGNYKKLHEEKKKHIKTEEEIAAGNEKAKKAQEAERKELEEYNKIIEHYNALADKQNDQILQSVQSSAQYTDILAKQKDGTISHTQAVEQLATEYRSQQKDIIQLTGLQDALNEAMSGNAPAEVIAELTLRIEALKNKLGGAKTEASALDVLLGSLGSAGASALGDAIRGGFTKDSLKDSLQGLGSAGGDALAKYIGRPELGPIFSAVGEKAGKAIFDGFNHVFGGRDAQGKIRDSLDKLFADALKDNPLQAIIDGQLSNISDLNFGKGTDIFSSGAFDDALAKLPGDFQAAFNGIAQGFTGVFGQGQELAGQLAAVLSNNLGGSLNNLQLLVQSTGVSFEQLKEQTVEAFLDGKLSALEAQTALNGIAQIAQKGIPDGIGLTTQAFDNLKAAGSKGGRAVVDALGDIGAEAKELGITTFPALIQNLASTGKYSAAEIQEVFDALQANGIDTVDELTNATANELLPVLAQLEGQGFLTDQAQAAKDLADSLDEIPSEKTVVFNFKGNFDSTETKKAVEFAAGRSIGGPGELRV